MRPTVVGSEGEGDGVDAVEASSVPSGSFPHWYSISFGEVNEFRHNTTGIITAFCKHRFFFWWITICI